MTVPKKDGKNKPTETQDRKKKNIGMGRTHDEQLALEGSPISVDRTPDLPPEKARAAGQDEFALKLEARRNKTKNSRAADLASARKRLGKR